jgi:hypothetical protein
VCQLGFNCVVDRVSCLAAVAAGRSSPLARLAVC